MARLKEGQKLPDFVYDTPFQKEVRFSETATGANKTALVFLRYYGCTLCQYDIHKLAKNYADIVSGGGRLIVVLQSAPEKLAAQIKPGDLPFDIICDPQQLLYNRFDIVPAKSKSELADFVTGVKIVKATVSGFKHGDYEGEELQLPAVFIVDSNLTLDYVYYGKSAGDVPEAATLKKLLQ